MRFFGCFFLFGMIFASFTNPPWGYHPKGQGEAKAWQAYSSLVERTMAVYLTNAVAPPTSKKGTSSDLRRYKIDLRDMLDNTFWVDPDLADEDGTFHSWLETNSMFPRLTSTGLLEKFSLTNTWYFETPYRGASTATNGWLFWTQLMSKVVWTARADPTYCSYECTQAAAKIFGYSTNQYTEGDRTNKLWTNVYNSCGTPPYAYRKTILNSYTSTNVITYYEHLPVYQEWHYDVTTNCQLVNEFYAGENAYAQGCEDSNSLPVITFWDLASLCPSGPYEGFVRKLYGPIRWEPNYEVTCETFAITNQPADCALRVASDVQWTNITEAYESARDAYYAFGVPSNTCSEILDPNTDDVESYDEQLQGQLVECCPELFADFNYYPWADGMTNQITAIIGTNFVRALALNAKEVGIVTNVGMTRMRYQATGSGTFCDDTYAIDLEPGIDPDYIVLTYTNESQGYGWAMTNAILLLRWNATTNGFRYR